MHTFSEKMKNIRDEVVIPILYIFELTAQINVTSRTSRCPLCVIKFVKGLTNECECTLIKYVPSRIKSTPANPVCVGNSPSMKGDVISKKNGLNPSRGATTEMSVNLIALKSKRDAIALMIAVMKSASKKLF